MSANAWLQQPAWNVAAIRRKVLTMKCSIALGALLQVVLVISAPPLFCTDQTAKPAEARYYPLALGNIWTYRVHRVSPKTSDSVVEWRVTHAGDTYQVWPKPMQSDDEAM